MVNIFKFLEEKKIDKLKIGIKNHPRFDQKPEFEEFGTIIPAYIPAEFLVIENTKIMMAISSSSLFPIYNVNTIKISFVNLVEWNNVQEYHRIYQALKDNKQGNLFFPENMEELYSLIENRLLIS